jgi:uncharacterized membrane protein/glutaredoxin
MAKDNSTQVLTRFIAEMAIPVTRKSISDELEKHPDYNSMLAFSDVLNNYNVTNSAYRLGFDQLPEVPLPFITYLSNKNYAVVTKFEENGVTLSHDNWRNKVFTPDEFKKQYGGFILVAEKEANSGETGYAIKHREELINYWLMPIAFSGLAIIFISLLLLNSAYLNSFNLQIALLILFKTMGLATSILLLTQSIDANNPLIQKLCGGDNNKNCNAILSSKAAKIAGISWSEIGFFYFAGTLLVLMFNSSNTTLILALALLNLISLPYTFYSIYYQWRVAKQWCRLCCTVQALLWVEFFALLPTLQQGIQTPNLTEWTRLAMSMALPIFLWIVSKPYLLQLTKLSPLTSQLRKFKYNKELFEKMLNDEVRYTLPTERHSLIIGNYEAESIITMVSNPYCQPCAKAHKALNEWMSSREDIKLQVVFSTQNNEKDKKTEIAAHLMALQDNRDNVSLKNALNDWYEQKQKNFKIWAKEYPVEKRADTSEFLEAQKEWCKMVEIKSTPTLFLNGRRLPNTYQPEDLKYFL